MSEWISVDERLPPKETDGDFKANQVIVTNGIEVGVTDFNSWGMPNSWAAFDDYGDIPPDQITHWMPLPEPPK